MTRSSSTGTCTGAAAPPALLIDDCLSDSDGCPRSWCRTARGRGKRAAGGGEEEGEAGVGPGAGGGGRRGGGRAEEEVEAGVGPGVGRSGGRGAEWGDVP